MIDDYTLLKFRDVAALIKSVAIADHPTASANVALNLFSSPRAHNALKAAVDVMGNTGITPPDVLSALFPLIKRFSAFERMLPFFRELPMETRAAILAGVEKTLAATPPAGWLPVHELGLGASEVLEQRKVGAILVMTDELYRSILLADSLNALVAEIIGMAVDFALLEEIFSNTSIVTAPASGTDSDSILSDLASVSDLGSSLWLIVDPTTHNRLSVKSANGQMTFPDLEPNGGTIGNYSIAPSSALSHFADSSGRYAIVLDPSKIIANRGQLQIESSRQAALQMSNTPTDEPSDVVSMFQTNSIATRIIRSFGLHLADPASIQIFSGVNW